MLQWIWKNVLWICLLSLCICYFSVQISRMLDWNKMKVQRLVPKKYHQSTVIFGGVIWCSLHGYKHLKKETVRSISWGIIYFIPLQGLISSERHEMCWIMNVHIGWKGWLPKIFIVYLHWVGLRAYFHLGQVKPVKFPFPGNGCHCTLLQKRSSNVGFNDSGTIHCKSDHY